MLKIVEIKSGSAGGTSARDCACPRSESRLVQYNSEKGRFFYTDVNNSWRVHSYSAKFQGLLLYAQILKCSSLFTQLSFNFFSYNKFHALLSSEVEPSIFVSLSAVNKWTRLYTLQKSPQCSTINNRLIWRKSKCVILCSVIIFTGHVNLGF